MNKIYVLLLLLFMVAGNNYALAEENIFTGITEAVADTTISATITGRISVIKRKEGQFVKKGDVIIELEKEGEKLEAARRKLISESKFEMNSALKKTKTLERYYMNTKQLFESSQSESEEELLQKELEYKLALDEYESLCIAEKKEDLEYKIAVVELEKHIIRAPIDGIVVDINPEIGESCNIQEPLVRIADVRKCRFIAYIEAKEAHGMKPGQKVKLEIEGSKVPIIRKGIIEYVAPVVDPSSGLRKVKVLFNNRDKSVQPGVISKMILEDK